MTSAFVYLCLDFGLFTVRLSNMSLFLMQLGSNNFLQCAIYALIVFFCFCFITDISLAILFQAAAVCTLAQQLPMVCQRY